MTEPRGQRQSIAFCSSEVFGPLCRTGHGSSAVPHSPRWPQRAVRLALDAEGARSALAWAREVLALPDLATEHHQVWAPNPK